MNTKLLLTATAVSLGLLGIVFTFLPAEILGLMKIESTLPLNLLIQIVGAMYFGFAMLNWMQKSGKIGGIYNRPIAVANLSHFTIAALALLKGLISNPSLPTVIWIFGGIYLLLAISFAVVLFHDPLSDTKKSN